MNRFWNVISQYVANHALELERIGWNIVKIIILVIAAKILVRVICRIANRVLHLRTKIDDRRKNTLEALFQNFVKYTIYFVLLLTILPMFGIHIAALLAGAGVAGIAIAFGAQSLLKDFFNGLFILFEDQYGVGDYVAINGTWGQIRTIGLRITVIKVWTGELVVIPNGQINQVINYSKENSVAVVEVNVGYKTDVEEAIGIVQKVMENLKNDQSNIVGDVTVLGVEALNDSTYTIRATAECEPYTHWGIIRLAKQMFVKRFQNRT